jgi:hypothetical protein
LECSKLKIVCLKKTLHFTKALEVVFPMDDSVDQEEPLETMVEPVLILIQAFELHALTFVENFEVSFRNSKKLDLAVSVLLFVTLDLTKLPTTLETNQSFV